MVASGQPLEIIGLFEAKIGIGKSTERAEFYVNKNTGELLIGRETAERLGILKIDCEVNGVDDNKETLGPMKKTNTVLVAIPIRTDARQVIQPYRRVSHLRRLLTRESMTCWLKELSRW